MKSQRATNKMQLTAIEGKWTGGPIPIGLEVVCMSLEGKEKWRVLSEGHQLRIKISPDGAVTRYDGPDNFPSRDATDWLTLRPTKNEKMLATIRDIFIWYDSEAITAFSIASRLNKQNRKCPIHWRWEPYHITYMLKNPVYTGFPTFNKIGQGKWTAWQNGKLVEHETPKRRNTKNARADWQQAKARQFDPIVSDEQFDRVYAKINSGTSRAKAPKSPALWLSGLLVCAGCGAKMIGAKRRKADVYWCRNNVKKVTGCTCGLNTLEHNKIEQHLRTYLADAGKIIDELNVRLPVDPSPADIDTFRESVGRAQDCYYEMARAVGKHGRKSTPEEHKQGIIIMTMINPPYENGKDEITDSYNKLFSQVQPRIQAEHDQLETEHTRLTLAWSDLPSQRAKEKARTRLAELESELEALEKKLVNYSDGWAESLSSLHRVQRDWRQMAEDVTSNKSGRIKTEAVSRIIAEIRCKFEKTGLHRPANRLVEVQFVPKIGQSVTINTEESAHLHHCRACG
jgi:hypothetical protein